jgi:hypothetical protein
MTWISNKKRGMGDVESGLKVATEKIDPAPAGYTDCASAVLALALTAHQACSSHLGYESS